MILYTYMKLCRELTYIKGESKAVALPQHKGYTNQLFLTLNKPE